MDEVQFGEVDWADIQTAVDALTDDRLDASIRYFGQAGSAVTDRAAELLTDLMLARMTAVRLRD